MNTTQFDDIFSYITASESLYQKDVPLNDKMWGMRDHIKRSVLYRDSDIEGNKTEMTPIKNITRPILNLQYRTEDIDVKDVQIYVDDPGKYHLSFLVRKYHDDVFTQKYDIDSFLDELNQSRIDFGGGLSKSLASPCPEVVQLQSIAFCDQTDILSGPIGIKHYYSPDQLLDMKDVGWGSPAKGATASLEDVIRLSRTQKREKDGTVINTPGRYIEVYEVHGNLPVKFYNREDDSDTYETRLYIVAFYHKENSDDRQGIVLYTAPEPESPFKFVKRGSKNGIYGRALDFGGAEELFEDQVWTNYAEIRKLGLLDATSKVLLQTDDPTVTQKQNVRDLENLSVIEVAPGATLRQVDTTPRSLPLFENAVNAWEQHAKDMAAAQDPIQGKAGGHGDPFAAQQAQIVQSMGLHDYRRGIFAKHVEEIYRDWIIPYIQKEIVKGTTFLSELSLDELQMVAANLSTNLSNKWVKEQILNGVIPTPQQIDEYKQQVQTQFKKRGNKHFIEILKDEFNDVDLGVKVTVAGKSKDLASRAKDIVAVLNLVRSNLYMLQVPPIAELVNQAIEAIGMNPVDFSAIKISSPPPNKTFRTNIDYKDVAAIDPKSAAELLQDDGVMDAQPQSQPSPVAAPTAGMASAQLPQ